MVTENNKQHVLEVVNCRGGSGVKGDLQEGNIWAQTPEFHREQEVQRPCGSTVLDMFVLGSWKLLDRQPPLILSNQSLHIDSYLIRFVKVYLGGLHIYLLGFWYIKLPGGWNWASAKLASNTEWAWLLSPVPDHAELSEPGCPILCCHEVGCLTKAWPQMKFSTAEADPEGANSWTPSDDCTIITGQQVLPRRCIWATTSRPSI